jgi:hypothetical protein
VAILLLSGLYWGWLGIVTAAAAPVVSVTAELACLGLRSLGAVLSSQHGAAR